MKSFREFILDEAKVSDKDIGPASELIKSYLNRHGANFAEYGRIEIEKDGSKLIQNQYIDEAGQQAIGINWKENGTFVSISLWSSLDTIADETTTPDVEITFDAEDYDSFAQVLPELQKIIIGTSSTNESVLKEAAQAFEYNGKTYKGLTNLIDAVYKDGESEDFCAQLVQDIYGNDSKDIFVTAGYRLLSNGAKKLAAADVYAEVANLKKNSKVKVSAGKTQKEKDPDVASNNKKLKEVKYADPKTVYKKLEAFTKSVAEGTTTALLITGKGGTGKSYTVTKTLDQYAPGEWHLMKGRCTARAMYMTLYNHYQDIVVFDDCDSIFKDSNGMNVLKGCLDTSEHRVIGWATADAVNTEGLSHEEIETVLAAEKGNPIPSEFHFEGQVIFISNLTVDDIKAKDQAIITRCQLLDVTLSDQGILERMESILPEVRYFKARPVNGHMVEITNEDDKREVFAYLSQPDILAQLKSNGEELSMRTLIKACKLKLSCPNDWKEMII